MGPIEAIRLWRALGEIKNAEAKGGIGKMDIVGKLIASFIERSCKNYVTTIIGIICVLIYSVNTFGNVVPAQYHMYVNLGASILSTVALILAKDSGSKVDIPTPTKLLTAFILVGLLCLGVSTPIQAQTLPTNIYAGGMSYAVGASSPAIAGTGLYARLVSSDAGTYAFTVVDAVPATYKPFVVTTNFGVGVAQKVVTIGKVNFFTPTSAGVSYTGSNTGWSWTTGVLVNIPVKGNWSIMPNCRLVKSSVSSGTGYQPIIGVLAAWGK